MAHDNGEIAAVTVNGVPAMIVRQQSGVADRSLTLDASADGRLLAKATDRAGNVEAMPHVVRDAGAP